MKQSNFKSVNSLVEELENQRKLRKDIIADTSCMSFSHDDGVSKIFVSCDGVAREYNLSTTAKHQLANRLNIPWYYYERMEKHLPDLLVDSVNEWLRYSSEARMLRTMGDELRAFLSPKYRRIENLEVLHNVLNLTAGNDDLEPMSMAITDTYMYLKIVSKSMKEEIEVGDVVRNGFCITNSEVGLSSLMVHSLIYRLVCSNGLVIAQRENGYRQVHRGNMRVNGSQPYFLNEGISDKDRETFASIRPLMKNALDAHKFGVYVKSLRTAKEVTFNDNSQELIRVIGEQYRMTLAEREVVLGHYLSARDYSVFGLVQATTRASQDLSDYGRASYLEEIGGDILRDYNSPSRYLPAYQLVA